MQIAGWAFVLASYAALVARIAQGGPFVYRFFNADTLYLAALYRDLFARGGAWTDWQLPSAPFYFPDTPLYFLLYRLTGGFEAATLLYGLAQYALLLFALQRALGIALRAGEPPASVLFVGGGVLLLLGSGAFDAFAFVLLPTAHISALVFGVVAFLLLRRYEERESPAVLAALLVGTAAICASDRLGFVSAVLPACACAALSQRSPRRTRAVAGMLGAAALGLAIFYAEGWLHSAPPVPVVRRSLDPALLLAAFAEQPTLAGVIAVAVLGHVEMFRRRRQLDRDAVVYFLSGHAAILVAAPLLARRGDLLVHQRYFSVVWIFGACLAAAFALRRVRHRAAPSLGWGAAAAAAALSVWLGRGAVGSPHAELEGGRFYPRITRCADLVAAERGRRETILLANYWVARLVELTSRRGITAVAVTQELEPSAILQGRALRERAETRGVYDLLVLWWPGAWQVTHVGGVLDFPVADRKRLCPEVPHPKLGRPAEGVPVWEFTPPQPLPWLDAS